MGDYTMKWFVVGDGDERRSGFSFGGKDKCG